MHVARIKSGHVDKTGRRRDYQSVYLRRSYRDGGKVKHEQLANLSALPEAAITAIEAVLAGATMVPANTASIAVITASGQCGQIGQLLVFDLGHPKAARCQAAPRPDARGM